MEVIPGVYQHYKGNYYRVLFVARHTELSIAEKDELLVIYVPLYETPSGWGRISARPLQNFVEEVIVEGHSVPRFRKIED